MVPWVPYTNSKYCRSYECDMRDDNEKQILKAIKENDVETLKKITTNLVGRRLGWQNISILSVAVLKGACEVVEFLIDNGCCDPREIDANGNTVLHLLVSEHMRKQQYYGAEKSYRFDIADVLLTAYSSDAVEAVFVRKNKMRMTPFLWACAVGCDDYILHFLSKFETINSISIDEFIGLHNANVFHFLLYSLPYSSTTRSETIRAMIDKIPRSRQLIDAKNSDDATPLYVVLFRRRQWHSAIQFREAIGEAIDLAKILLSHGASLDILDQYDAPYLYKAVSLGDVSRVEFFLRAGCRTDCHLSYASPLSELLFKWRKSNIVSIPIIELFLAFGYDLQKELYLYTSDELPIEFLSSAYSNRRDATCMDPKIVEALRQVRRSNKLLSLQRQCRNTLRRYLKEKADDVIENLTCVPNAIKSFLLVQNEIPLLEISESLVTEHVVCFA